MFIFLGKCNTNYGRLNYNNCCFAAESLSVPVRFMVLFIIDILLVLFGSFHDSPKRLMLIGQSTFYCNEHQLCYCIHSFDIFDRAQFFCFLNVWFLCCILHLHEFTLWQVPAQNLPEEAEQYKALVRKQVLICSTPSEENMATLPFLVTSFSPPPPPFLPAPPPSKERSTHVALHCDCLFHSTSLA